MCLAFNLAGWLEGGERGLTRPNSKMLAIGGLTIASSMSRVRSGFRQILDFVLPPRCAPCRDAVIEPGHVCLACFRDISLIGDPCCARCGYPFDGLEAGADIHCAACLAAPPRYHRARSAARYDGQMRRLVLKLKNGSTDVAPALARLMVPAFHALISEGNGKCTGAIDVDELAVIPVPLHPRRLFERRYNQSQLLASALCRQIPGLAVRPDVLERVRATPKQHGLGIRGRRRNVDGAFRIGKAGAAWISGRPVLLVDDVLTTGATLDACAGPLLRAGASRVMALTAARVDMARRA